MAATFVFNLIRYRQEGYQSDRDVIVVLETDEEISDAHGYGIKWLIAHQRGLIDAEFALNEGGSVGVKDGKPIWNGVQTSEKVYQSFWLGSGSSGFSAPEAVDRVRLLANRVLARQ
jgi:acetylornithine deacetylase/succinyl-diaminopimelate desuccinylase-like protein